MELSNKQKMTVKTIASRLQEELAKSQLNEIEGLKANVQLTDDYQYNLTTRITKKINQTLQGSLRLNVDKYQLPGQQNTIY